MIMLANPICLCSAVNGNHWHAYKEFSQAVRLNHVSEALHSRNRECIDFWKNGYSELRELSAPLSLI